MTTREPAWTAAPIPSSQMVAIFYALSYHLDLGCPLSGCPSGWTAHYGDSEWIVVVVEPSSVGSSRWRVVEASLSAHWNQGLPGVIDHSQTVHRNNLFWADEYGGRPLIWVSKWKHANYRSKSSCNGKVNDTCSGNLIEPHPLEVDAGRRLGLSWGTQLNNCFTSIQGFPGVECYWHEPAFFGGWYDSWLMPRAGGYWESLDFFGF